MEHTLKSRGPQLASILPWKRWWLMGSALNCKYGLLKIIINTTKSNLQGHGWTRALSDYHPVLLPLCQWHHPMLCEICIIFFAFIGSGFDLPRVFPLPAAMDWRCGQVCGTKCGKDSCRFVHQIKIKKNKTLTRILGTKADLEDQRRVEPVEADKLCRAHNMLQQLDVSSKNNTNVDTSKDFAFLFYQSLVFYEMARQLKSQYDVGNLEANRGDSFRLNYPDTTNLSNRWRRCCNYYWFKKIKLLKFLYTQTNCPADVLHILLYRPSKLIYPVLLHL